MTARQPGSPPAAPAADLAGAGLIVLAAACFGTLGPLARFAGDAGVSALALVTWRAAIGALCMALFIGLLWRSARRVAVPIGSLPARDRWFMVAAAIANTILNLSVFVAWERISIALGLLIFYLYPAYVALASVAWFGERLDALRWGALGVSLVGMVLVVVGAGSVGTPDPLGIGLAFISGVAQMFYVLSARHGFAEVPGPQAAMLTMSGAALLYVLVAVAIGSLGVLGAPVAGVDAFVPVLLAGVVGAGVPTVAYITGIRRLGAPRAAILATLEPVVGVALAAVLLHEEPVPLQLVGGALILIAAVLLQVRRGADVGEHEGVADEPA